MVTNDRQAAQLASTLAWLEDNVRENKAGITRITQQLEQAQTQVWDLAHRLHRSEEIAAALANEMGFVPGLVAQLSSAGDRVTRVEDRQNAVEHRLGEAVRQHQLELEHMRGELNELVKRMDGWERPTQNWASRFDVLEEAARRGQDATSVVRQRLDDFERYLELVDQRGARTADALKRYDQELTRFSADVDALQKQDTTIAERIQVYAEVFKRLDEELVIVAQQNEVRQEFNEKLDLHRTMIRRAEERLNAVEAFGQEAHERLEDQTRGLTSLESRERLFRERLGALQEELATYRGHVAEQFQKSQATVEKQKRRRIEDIEREIRELKVNAYRPPEE